MSNPNIVMSCQNNVDIPLDEGVSIYVNEEGQLKQKNSDGTEYTIYCSNN